MICQIQNQRLFKRRGNLTYAVPEPVGRGRQTDAARSNRKREDLSNDHPGTRAPGGSEEGDVEADEGDHSRNSSIVLLRWSAGCDTNDSDDKLHNDHSRASDDEDLAATEAFDCPKGDRCRTDVDKRRDEGDKEGVLNRAKGGEKNRSEVENEVNSSQLLHHLHEDP